MKTEKIIAKLEEISLLVEAVYTEKPEGWRDARLLLIGNKVTKLAKQLDREEKGLPI